MSCRPPGTRVHLRPCCTVIGRPPHIIQYRCNPSPHQDDAAVRYRHAGGSESCRPSGTHVYLRPCRAVIGRPPHVIPVVGAVTTTHQDDTAVRRCHAAEKGSWVPPGTRVYLRPRFRVIIVAKEPGPTGGGNGRGIRKRYRKGSGPDAGVPLNAAVGCPDPPEVIWIYPVCVMVVLPEALVTVRVTP